MKSLSLSVLCILGAICTYAQTGLNCNDSQPFCAENGNEIFTNNVNVPDLGEVDCLGSTPNPVWYHMQVATSGNIVIDMSQEDIDGEGLDVDFAIWGPFADLSTACGPIFPAGGLVDCSYDPAPEETVNIPNAQAGEFYILLITNYSDLPGTITFAQTNIGQPGAGSTDCSILSAEAQSNGPLCEGEDLMFTSMGNPGATHNWTGPGGFASTQQNPVISDVTLAQAGTYRLIISDGTSSDTMFVNVVIKPVPQAALAAVPQVCLGKPVTFDASASQPAAGIDNFQWIFTAGGPVGQTTTVPGSTFTYAVPGTFNASVIVTDSICADTANVSVSVAPLPVVALDMPAQTCENSEIVLDASASSVTAPFTLVDFAWDFENDGANDAVAATPIIQHTFAQGPHSVKLTLRTDAGCKDSLVRDIQVFGHPQVDFDFNEVCLEGTTQFDNLTPPTVPPTAFNWNFGPGAASMLADPSFVFPALGNHTVTLIGTVGNLCSDTVEKDVPIVNAVSAGFSFNGICGYDAFFTDQSFVPTGAVGTINSWTWDFGDGTASNEQNPAHTYLQDNVNTVTLTVATAEGCTDTRTHDVAKFAIPDAAFSSGPVCLGSPTEFMDLSTVFDGEIATWEWNFDDMATSDGPLVQHTYGNAGQFPVRLVVTTANGCSDTAQVVVEVFPAPEALFHPDPPETDITAPDVQFIDASTGAVDWNWSIGFLGTSNQQNLSWTFPHSGTYEIVLTVANEHGCTDKYRQDYVVRPVYHFYAPNSFTPNNGDQLNKYWRIHTLGVKELKLHIFDRWGELLYSTNDLDFGWSGNYHGKRLPPDMYVYKANTVDAEGKQHEQIGHIQLLR